MAQPAHSGFQCPIKTAVRICSYTAKNFITASSLRDFFQNKGLSQPVIFLYTAWFSGLCIKMALKPFRLRRTSIYWRIGSGKYH
jgi:hypothetical protein